MEPQCGPFLGVDRPAALIKLPPGTVTKLPIRAVLSRQFRGPSPARSHSSPKPANPNSTKPKNNRGQRQRMASDGGVNQSVNRAPENGLSTLR